MEKFKTRKEMATALGLSNSTFYRRLKDLGIHLPKGLICPQKQEEIRRKLSDPGASREG